MKKLEIEASNPVVQDVAAVEYIAISPLTLSAGELIKLDYTLLTLDRLQRELRESVSKLERLTFQQTAYEAGLSTELPTIQNGVALQDTSLEIGVIAAEIASRLAAITSPAPK